MMLLSATLLEVFCAVILVNGTVAKFVSRGAQPALPHDDRTTSDCTWWHDQTSSFSCATILSSNAISMNQFSRWNPSVGSTCQGLATGRSYCVEAAFENLSTLPTATSTSTTLRTQSSTPVPPSAIPSNGIQTPLPTQPGLVSDCDSFYFVKSGDGCASIASNFDVTLSQFLQWNPKAGRDCGGLWADAYACVSVVGHSLTTPAPSPTKSSNGIATPLPTQPGMVNNCDVFYLVKSGDSCAAVASANGISISQFSEWNTKVGTTCGGLWADAYACVSIIGHSTTPTQPGNGINTPAPVQSGMINNCNKFLFVESGQNCPEIQAKYGISLPNLVKWNPAIKADCTGMWASTYLCVGIIS